MGERVHSKANLKSSKPPEGGFELKNVILKKKNKPRIIS
jgi:hypothetical protein